MGLTNPIVMDLAIPYYPTTKTVAIIMLVLLGIWYIQLQLTITTLIIRI